MALKFRGHVFADARSSCQCCMGDARRVINDPTGTRSLRRRFNGTMALRWRALRVLVRTMIKDQDLLALKSGGLLQPVQASVVAGGSKTLAFQRWIDWALNQVVLGGDGSVMLPFLSQGYQDGVTFAQKQVSRNIYSNVAGHRLDLLTTLATTELQGIMEAVSQQSVRAVANALLYSQNQMAIVRAIWSIIDKVGVVRTQAMAELMTVKAFNEGVLDTYEAAKVPAVGLVPEGVPNRRNFGDARRAGPGSRASRKRTPSRSTISRIRAAELAVEALGRVNVRTAGDDDVCDVCEGIADDGPYTINKARSLIPAHPRCRCTFVPASDARFAPDSASLGRVDVPAMLGRATSDDKGIVLGRGRVQAQDYNPNHDPDTGEFTSGEGGGGSTSLHLEAGKHIEEGFKFHGKETYGGEEHAVFHKGGRQVLIRSFPESSGYKLNSHDPGNPATITNHSLAMKRLPKGAETESGAAAHFRKQLEGQTFYHEVPGNSVASIKKNGIKSEYGAFAAVGEHSGFVKGEKTVVKFKVPKSSLKNISPDMIYHGETMTAEQHAILSHPNKLKGAYVSHNGNVPPSWIESVTHHKSTQDYNHNHDPGNGQFSEGSSGSDGPATLSEDEFNNLKPDWKSIEHDKVRHKMIRQATENWFGAGYEDVNAELRAGKEWQTGPHQRDIRGLNLGFEMLGKNLPRDTTLYRGVTTTTPDDFNEGAEFTDLGFNSTTHEKATAASFGTDFEGRTGLLLHINAKKGTRVYVPEIPETDGSPTSVEPEVLLNRGTKYRVTKRSGKDVYVELV